ncbi:hypothetical protein AAGT00_00015 (plasmid) [Streptomyces cavourensis]
MPPDIEPSRAFRFWVPELRKSGRFGAARGALEDGTAQDQGVEYPIRPALARSVPTLPTGPDWHFEIKVDGHRMVLRLTGDGVVLYSRTGRVITSQWMDLAVPAMQLPPGVTLDGEAVIWQNGRLDFGAVQARASSSLERARALAARLPASYVAFDVLAHPDHGDAAARPYTERRALLEDVL